MKKSLIKDTQKESTLIDKLKPLQYFYNLLLKSNKIPPSKKSLEEEMFWLEQELDIPSYLRWYNKNK